jgi:hypothetical protein
MILEADLKSRMRENRTYGSVRGRCGDASLYSTRCRPPPTHPGGRCDIFHKLPGPLEDRTAYGDGDECQANDIAEGLPKLRYSGAETEQRRRGKEGRVGLRLWECGQPENAGCARQMAKVFGCSALCVSTVCVILPGENPGLEAKTQVWSQRFSQPTVLSLGVEAVRLDLSVGKGV